MTTASQPTAGSRTKPGSATGRRGGQILHPGSTAMLLGGLLMALGSLLPWVATPAGSLSGTAGAGLWTLCAGAIAIAGALIPYRRIAIAHAVVPGVAAATIVVWQLARLAHLSASTDSWGNLLPGIGLVLVGGASVVLIRATLRMRHAA